MTFLILASGTFPPGFWSNSLSTWLHLSPSQLTALGTLFSLPGPWRACSTSCSWVLFFLLLSWTLLSPFSPVTFFVGPLWHPHNVKIRPDFFLYHKNNNLHFVFNSFAFSPKASFSLSSLQPLGTICPAGWAAVPVVSVQPGTGLLHLSNVVQQEDCKPEVRQTWVQSQLASWLTLATNLNKGSLFQ